MECEIKFPFCAVKGLHVCRKQKQHTEEMEKEQEAFCAVLPKSLRLSSRLHNYASIDPER